MGKIIKRPQPDSNIPPVKGECKSNPEGTSALSGEKTSKTKRIEVRKNLADTVKATCHQLKEAGFDKLAVSITNLVAKAARDRFSVCFVGEFSHGKSTLINKVLGVDVLPTDNLPTTSLLTSIVYGKDNILEVFDNKGKLLDKLPMDKKSWDGLTSYDSEGNSVETENRYFVKICINDEWLGKTGINMLDTPGANDGSKSRDMEISRALMVTDGAVVCVDAQKGIMLSQEAFIRDRLLSPKVPFVAVAITHLDLVKEENRDRVVAFIIAKLRSMKADIPVVITNDVGMPSDRFVKLIGVDKLRAMIIAWKNNPTRSDRIETWLAVSVQNILSSAIQAYMQKKEIIEAQGEDRKKIIIEKQAAITAIHDEWEKLRVQIKERCDSCRDDFKRRLEHERANIIAHMKYRISIVPDPAKWYEQSYDYELSTRISASIISLDNLVTENARNDFDKVNKELMSKFKAVLERDNKTWGRTPDSNIVVHAKNPELADITEIQDKSVKITAVATAAAGILATSVLGFAGIVGTVGAATAVRLLTKNKIDKEVSKARQELSDFVEYDVKKALNEATRDCESRISLIYGDIDRASKLSECTWMQAQHEMIASTSNPIDQSADQTITNIDTKIQEFEKLRESFEKFIK